MVPPVSPEIEIECSITKLAVPLVFAPFVIVWAYNEVVERISVFQSTLMMPDNGPEPTVTTISEIFGGSLWKEFSWPEMSVPVSTIRLSPVPKVLLRVISMIRVTNNIAPPTRRMYSNAVCAFLCIPTFLSGLF